MEGHFGTIDVAFSRGGDGIMFCLFVSSVNWTYWIYSVYNCKYVLCSMGAVLPANKVNHLILSYTLLQTNIHVCISYVKCMQSIEIETTIKQSYMS